MKLSTATRTRPTISLVAMIDVLMIMLIFFMVTSTYLNLDMIPMAERGERERGSTTQADTGPARKTLIRLGADGVPYVRGQPMDAAGLFDLARGRLAENALTEFLILPSGHAGMQSLVTVMDTIVRAGGTRVRVVRLEARP